MYDKVPDAPVERSARAINRIVSESRLPTEKALGYRSSVGIFGGKLRKLPDGKYLFDMTGLISRADRLGDRVLRSTDEHHVKDPISLAVKHPFKLVESLKLGRNTKRQRGTPEQIADHINELGLGEYYELYRDKAGRPIGILVKHPEVLEKAVNLQDICRRKSIKSSGILDKVDISQAYVGAASYLGSFHDKGQAVGEVLLNDFFFHCDKDGKIDGEPILNIPDIVWNPKIKTGLLDKKATDLLDFLTSSAFEEMRSRSEKSTDQAIRSILDGYLNSIGNQEERLKVVRMVGSFARRGRGTIAGDDLSGSSRLHQAARVVFAQHNKARLFTKEGLAPMVRKVIAEICSEYSR